jgi:hypothetical protein
VQTASNGPVTSVHVKKADREQFRYHENDVLEEVIAPFALQKAMR